MAKGDDGESSAPHSKKKRTDLEALPSDAGQKPIQLQRRRVWRACESCRRKKIKCDGVEPTCSQCSGSGSHCTWLQTKDRAAFSRHYVQELEARLLHMESVFTQLAPVVQQMGISTNGIVLPGTSTVSSASADPQSVTSPSAPSEDRPSASVKLEDEVSDSFGQLALDEYGHMRWIGGSSTMSLVSSFRALTSSSPVHRISPMEEDPMAPGPSVNKLYFPASVFFGKIRALPGPEEVEYPDRDLADKLVEAYFARFHFLMPVIDKPSFLQDYRRVMDNVHDHRYAQSETPFVSLVFAVFACAANSVQDPRLSTARGLDDGGMGMVFYERALILQYISHANIQPAHVQCCTILATFLCSINCLPQAWILLGQAVRTGQDLGLHRTPRRLLISPIEKETRRKIWWGVYSLDRMLALALGRPLGINDSDCDVEYPVEIDDEFLPEYFSGSNAQPRQPSLMTGFIQLTKLYEIGGRMLRQVYALENCKDNLEPERKAELQKIVETLDGDLTKWREDLPEAFKNQSDVAEEVSMTAVLHSHYYSILTTLHRNFLPLKRDQPVTAKSTSTAVSTARACIRLAPTMKNTVPPSHHLTFFIQQLFSSAVILLLYAMHAPDAKGATAAMDEAKSTLPALDSWEGTWPGAKKCRELLIELTETATQAIVKGPAGERHPVPSPPPTANPSVLERRRSVTITTSGLNSVPGRSVRNRARRNQSRDSGGVSRRMNAVSPYRVDSAHRARSSSRKRGHDETESNEAYYQNFPSPTSARPNTNSNSSHSSPASAHLPSPPMSVKEHAPEPAQPQTPVNPNFHYGSPPGVSPGVASPSRYDYDYNLTQQGSSQWSNDPNLDLYSQDSGNISYGNAYGTYDLVYPVYDVATEFSNPALSTTPPTASFAATGLPFRGLEFIRNYNNSANYVVGDQDNLWQSYDPTAFEYNPEIPFTLGDNDMAHDPHTF